MKQQWIKNKKGQSPFIIFTFADISYWQRSPSRWSALPQTTLGLLLCVYVLVWWIKSGSNRAQGDFTLKQPVYKSFTELQGGKRLRRDPLKKRLSLKKEDRENLFYLQKKKTLPFAKREMLHELNTTMAWLHKVCELMSQSILYIFIVL